jgi:hypothetical protein
VVTLTQPPGSLSVEAVAARRQAPRSAEQVMFAIKALYGLSTHSVRLPLNAWETIDSGQICATIDPDADPSCNKGILNYSTGRLVVRYGVHAVFPGLNRLIVEGRHDPSLLHPVRAVATDDCTLTPDARGWRALGCLDFLPGSIWAGAHGG